MANSKSAEKRARSAGRRRDVNSQMVSRARTYETRIRTLAEKGDVKAATALMPDLQSALDRAHKHNAMHANRVGRIKSRVSRVLSPKATSKPETKAKAKTKTKPKAKGK